MDSKLKRRVAIAAAGLAVVGGAGGAYAAGGGASAKPQRQAFLNDVAQRLHVSPQQLEAAIRGARRDHPRRPGARGFARPFGGHMHGLRARGPLRAIFGAAAKYLGLTNAQLRDQLRAGKSLADVAGAQGKSVDGLKQAIRSAVDAQLDARLDAIVDRKGFGPRKRMMAPGGPPAPAGM
ncbi:MAG TPA: hypothetical protein VFT42_05055 [Solirubrobacteraceae bacterium]|nr:hypothetical protein [Solirubrobacteraceae bacterium]